mmetsp:Transcript_86001/g.243946  ORF Transcript_86001/g.243946 Transcript_86001/m.243946 type:complete len:261 (+) Transcript_86001:996-1778(+)
MVRARSRVPPPQEIVHSVHDFQSDHLQSTGQPWELQSLFSAFAPTQALPPYCAGSLVRARLCLPPPQVRVQVPQLPQSCHLQSTGQPFVPHTSSSLNFPLHALPPCFAFTPILRLRKRLPPPQLLEQSAQSPQSSNLQFTGQGRGLHLAVSFASPSHFRPPNLALTFWKRVLVCTPPPHVLLQFPHPFQSPQTQLTGQGAVLQTLLSVGTPPHFRPPYAALIATVRNRDVLPPPQVAEHGFQGAQAFHLQATGHILSLQS